MRPPTALLAVLTCAALAHADDGLAAAGPDTRTRAEVLAAAKEDFARRDENRDGVLRGAEIPAGWAERYDLDADGRVGAAEFLEVAVRPPKLRRATHMRDVAARAKFHVASFDANKDGVVQRAEYPGDPARFREYDRNKDDALSHAEVLAMARDEIAEIRRKIRSPGRHDFLVLFDSDRDNRVGLDEYDGPAADFRKLDDDGDGVVTYDELYPERMARRARKAEESAAKPEDLSVVDAMDADGDGKVARAEFKGSDSAWRRLDRNGDGFVTVADAR
jgi:Ca2+-binding EF-hand superfamily protein